MKISIEPQACKKIKACRKKLNLSQNEVAEALHMSQNSYSLMELGKTRITIERLYEIADFFKVSVIDLLPPPPIITSKFIFYRPSGLLKKVLRC